MIRRESNKYPGRYFWACRNKECEHLAWEIDGRVQTIAEKEAQTALRNKFDEMVKEFDKMAENDDGTPKFKCVACSSKVVKRPYTKTEKIGDYYWRCTNNDCQKFYMHNADSNEPYLDELAYQIKQATNENGKPIYPCFDCGGVMLRITPKSSPAFFRCANESCKHTFNSDEKGEPTKKAQWLLRAEARSKNSKGKYKWHCKKCKSPVLINDKKDKTGTYKKCSNEKCGAFYND